MWTCHPIRVFFMLKEMLMGRNHIGKSSGLTARPVASAGDAYHPRYAYTQLLLPPKPAS